jgi:hypothetical protein
MPCVQVFVQSAFFGEHGFALHHFIYLQSLQDGTDDLVVLFGIGRPMYGNTILLGMLLKLQQIMMQV